MGRDFYIKNMEQVVYKNRKLGLDLLRITSMVMIVALHFFGNSGMLKICDEKSIPNVCAWIFEAAFIVAVNIYVLISSYFLINSDFKIKKLVKLIIETLFYSVLIFIIFVIIGKEEINLKSLISNFFPIITKKYWFITVYLAMYSISPLLNIVIKNITQKNHKIMIVILYIICFILDESRGYSLYWFIVLYFVGAYIRLYKDDLIFNKIKCIEIYFLITIIVTISKFLIYNLYSTGIIKNDYSMVFYHYNSITILLSSIFVFLVFKNLNIKNNIIKKIITILAPSTFGVYLIHENSNIRNILYNDILHSNNYLNSNKYIAIAFLSIISIYIVCTIIDICRIRLFKLVSYLYNKIKYKYVLEK